MKVRRLIPSVLAAGLLTSLAALVGPADAAPGYNPSMTAVRGSDAARAATNLHVEIAQADGEHQIGDLRIALPRTYTFATDVPGTNGDLIGTAQLQAYIDPRPSTLTIEATVHDDNDGCNPAKQCVLVKANIPGIGAIELPLEIAQTLTEFVIEGDIGGLWNSDYVRGIDARLKKLTVDIFAKVGAHTVFGNPAVAGNHPFTYTFESAKISDLGHPGGLYPDCGIVCTVALEAKEYAPSRPNQGQPVLDNVTADDTAQTFTWARASDANGDVVTYDLTVNGPSGFTVNGLAGTTFAAGTLNPGNYTWTVTAVDATGLTTPSFTWGFVVVDADSALRFVSIANNDELLVAPGVGFVYRLGGVKATGSEFGGKAALTAPRGLIRYSGARFALNGIYDAELGTAVLTFTQANTARPFVDPAS